MILTDVEKAYLEKQVDHNATVKSCEYYKNSHGLNVLSLRFESDDSLSVAKFFEKYDATITFTGFLGNRLGNTVIVQFNPNKGQHEGLFLRDVQKGAELESRSDVGSALDISCSRK